MQGEFLERLKCGKRYGIFIRKEKSHGRFLGSAYRIPDDGDHDWKTIVGNEIAWHIEMNGSKDDLLKYLQNQIMEDALKP